jgi:L-iditol 2-dehydrogenase
MDPHMKALVLKQYNQLVYEDVPMPACGAGDVLVRVKASGICGSDVHGMDGSTGRRIPPLIMGHEASGVIAELDANVTGWSKGDRVTFDSTLYKQDDWYTRKGCYNLSDDRMVLGVSCADFRCDGAFAEFVAVPQHILHKIPDEVTFNQAAMVEPVAVALHALGLASISLNDAAVVVGTGVVGLFVVQALKAAGCRKIIAVDLDQDRLDLALRLGADVGLRPDTADVPGKIKKLCDGRGADLAFEVVGTSPAVRTAIECLRKGGTLTLVGNLSPTVEISLQTVVTRQLRLQGSCAICGEYPAALQMIRRGAINVDAVLSAVAPLSEGAHWFERLRKKEPGLMKVILLP